MYNIADERQLVQLLVVIEQVKQGLKHGVAMPEMLTYPSGALLRHWEFMKM